jgi:hypothetical protein
MSPVYNAWRTAVAGALAAHAAAVEQLAPGHWTFAPRTPHAPRGSARIADEWLIVDLRLPAPLADPFDGGWHTLAANAGLPGGLKLCTAGSEGALRLRADLPLLEDAPLALRMRQLCAGIDAAIAWLPSRQRSEAPSPLLTLGALEAADFDLRLRCRETQWPCTDRDAQTVMVQLDVPGAFQQAQVELQPGRGVVASVQLLAAPLPAPPHETAITRLLLATAGAVRMVRAATTPAPASVRLEVVFAHLPAADELGHAFVALSLAWRCAGRETEILGRDAPIAQLYACDGVEPRGGETVNHFNHVNRPVASAHTALPPRSVDRPRGG